MKRLTICRTAALLTLAASISWAQMPTPTLSTLVNGANQLGFDLVPKIAPRGNVFFSPASIASALLMAHAGAKGDTAAELAAALHISNLDPNSAEFGAAIRALVTELNRTTSQEDVEKWKKYYPNYEGPLQLSLVNALWGRRGHPFRQGFIDRLAETFGTELHSMDFQGDPDGSRNAINTRIADQTKDRIQNLLPERSITENTVLVLTNAIYFKNRWRDQFLAEATRPAPFYPTADANFEVPMMVQQDHFEYAEIGGARAISIPYEDGRQSMIVVLPAARHGLEALEASFSAEKLNALQKAMKGQLIRLQLPKVRIEQSYELADALRALGVEAAFSPRHADFSGMDDGKGSLALDRVIHKSFLAVDENGTEAAAATALVLVEGAEHRPEEPKPFVCDEPFLFFIVDRPTQMVLFQGRCVDPR